MDNHRFCRTSFDFGHQQATRGGKKNWEGYERVQEGKGWHSRTNERLYH